MNKNNYAVIMAGGVGSRFWPISTSKNPKQFHDMLGTGKSLIQKTFQRLEPLVPAENIIIATNKTYENLVLEQLPKIKKQQLFLEPAMRNTAPCILATALKIHQQNPNAVLLIAPSDHWIDDEKGFLRAIETSFKACESEDILMTLGIKPNAPNTGYGYIQYEIGKNEVKKVKKFTEKPHLEKAKEFLKQGDYLWNAGIFAWSSKSILKAFQEYLPEMYKLFNDGHSHWNTETEEEFVNTHYPLSENISIDFGLIEKANNVQVLPVDFGWNDLGTWGSLYAKKSTTDTENITLSGKTLYRKAQGNIVKSQDHKHIVVQGLNDFIIVEKEGVLLICPKEDEQDIKQIVKEAKQAFGNDFE